jgi:hypothetical protein
VGEIQVRDEKSKTSKTGEEKQAKREKKNKQIGEREHQRKKCERELLIERIV